MNTKRYISLIIVCVLTLGIMTFLFYLLLRQDNAYVTYIKLQVNPSFVMGINKDKKVVFYNALNNDGNKYNLSMFQGKDLASATKTFIEKLGSAKEEKSVINLTIMTKNNNLEKEIFDIMEKEIKKFDNNYMVYYHEPTFEELERYSNETVYNLDSSLENDDLKSISRDVYQMVNDYVEKKMKSLKLDKIKPEEKVALLKEQQEKGYFTDLSLSNMVLDNHKIVLLERSNYSITFSYTDNFEYSYKITLNLEVEYEKNELKHIVEVYKFNYELGEDKEILSNLKTYFYTF